MNVIEHILRFRTKLVIGISRRFHFARKEKQFEPATRLVIFYRISDNGYLKEKPKYVNNERCLRNAIDRFPLSHNTWNIIADNCCEGTVEMIKKYLPENCIFHCEIGHGAGTFRLALEMALQLDDKTCVYFLENDYIHRRNAQDVLLNGLSLAPYVTLYDHPDKYNNSHFKVAKGGEKTRVLLSALSHWKVTHSSTMTFASRVGILKQDRAIFERWTSFTHPYDCEIFSDLGRKGHFMICPIPGLSTHGECAFLAPLVDWEAE